MRSFTFAAVDVGQGISDAWRAVASFVPKLLAFLFILVIGWLIAKMVARLVTSLLDRFGFDGLADRGGIGTALAESPYSAAGIVTALIHFAVLLLTLQLAFGVFGPNPVSDLLTAIVGWLPRAVAAAVIIVLVAATASAVREMITNLLGGLSYGRPLGTAAAVFIWGVGAIAALDQIGVARTVTLPVLITVLATVGGVVVVGVGGGLVQPMRHRWEHWLNQAEHELPRAKAVLDNARRRGRHNLRPSEARTTDWGDGEPVSQRPGEYAMPFDETPPWRR